MNSGIVLVLILLLLVVALPVGLSTAEHLRSQRLAQPVAQFRYVFWRDFNLLSTLIQTALGLGLLVGAGAIIRHTGPGLLPVVLALAWLAWRQFAAIRLFWTYWRHDGQAHLDVYQKQKTALYTNREISFTFALSDVERLWVYHPPYSSRAASATYHYACLSFANHRNLFITCLLCDDIDLYALLPATPVEVVQQRLAWLPTEHKSSKLFGPYGK